MQKVLLTVSSSATCLKPEVSVLYSQGLEGGAAVEGDGAVGGAPDLPPLISAEKYVS